MQGCYITGLASRLSPQWRPSIPSPTRRGPENFVYILAQRQEDTTRRRGFSSCLQALPSHFPTEVQAPSLEVTTPTHIHTHCPLGKFPPMRIWMWSYSMISTRPLHPNRMQQTWYHTLRAAGPGAKGRSVPYIPSTMEGVFPAHFCLCEPRTQCCNEKDILVKR